MSDYFKNIKRHDYDRIFSYLDIKDIVNLELVSKGFTDIVHKSSTTVSKWKYTCYEAFLNVKEISICNTSKYSDFVYKLNEGIFEEKKYNYKKLCEKGVKIMLEWEGKYNSSSSKCDNYNLSSYSVLKKKSNVSINSLIENSLILNDFHSEYASNDDLDLIINCKKKTHLEFNSIPKKLSDDNNSLGTTDLNKEIIQIRNILFKNFRGKTFLFMRIY